MDKDYQLSIDGNILRFRTSSFRPERGSILHSGIYNRELSSVLSASVIAGVCFFILSLTIKNNAIIYIITLFIFTMAILFFRAVIFKEPYIEVVFDRDSGIVSIILKRPFKTLHRKFPIIPDNITLSHMEFEPTNPDGIEVVERVALQHGTVLPGFGEKKDFYNLELSMIDKGTEEQVIIFTTGKKGEAEEVMSKIKGFLWRKDDDNL